MYIKYQLPLYPPTMPATAIQVAAAVYAAALFHVIAIAILEQAMRDWRPGVRSVHPRKWQGMARAYELSDLNPTECRNLLRMDQQSLKGLLQLVKTHGLEDDRLVSAKEKLIIFLYICAQDATQRVAANYFQHSSRTISKIVHEVLEVLVICHPLLVTLEGNVDKVHDEPKYMPFKDAVGAVDGSLFHAKVPANERQEAWRTRKQTICQNVLIAVDFLGRFTYVMAGWEGSAHDNRVFEEAYRRGFRPPTHHYYLGDSGYALSSAVLTPYRNTRYHLSEWGLGASKPQNRRELYNLRHSSLRAVVEMALGRFKRKWKIMRKAPEYPFESQIMLVYALTAVSNFLTSVVDNVEDEEDNRSEDNRSDSGVDSEEEEGEDREAEEEEEEEQQPSEQMRQTRERLYNWRNKREMTRKRERIAEALWSNYTEELRLRGTLE
jgi:hypothetical protein